MKKVAVVTCIGFATVLGIQQYQLFKITDSVAEVSADLKFITQTNKQVAFSEKDEACLAQNIYYEAGVENEKGKYAVAQVTINRLETKRWGDTICKVVHAKAQFSWTLKKKLHKPVGKAWEDSQWIAHRVLRGDHVPSLEQSHFYHADYIKSPKWSKSMTEVTQIGRHIFYQKT